jgi:hypothetical protein
MRKSVSMTAEMPRFRPGAVDGCEDMARELFELIRDRHGIEEAHRIFAMFRPSSRRQYREMSSLTLLWRYDMMKPKNKALLARVVAKENEARGASKRKTGAGSWNPATLEKLITRLINRRKAGTWPWPSFTDGE